MLKIIVLTYLVMLFQNNLFYLHHVNLKLTFVGLRDSLGQQKIWFKELWTRN